MSYLIYLTSFYVQDIVTCDNTKGSISEPERVNYHVISWTTLDKKTVFMGPSIGGHNDAQLELRI